MTELQKKRYDIVKRYFDEYCYRDESIKVMSYYDMAWIINNHWDIKHFVTNEDDIEKKYEHANHYSIPLYQLDKVFKSITHAVKGTEIDTKRNGYMNSYLIQSLT